MKKQILVTFTATTFLVGFVGCRTAETEAGFRGSQLSDLPAAVQASVKERIGDTAINDIDKERRSGRVVYEITYADQWGENQKFHVAETGEMLTRVEASPAGWIVEEPAAGEVQLKGSKDSTDASASASIDRSTSYNSTTKPAAKSAKVDIDADVDVDADLDTRTTTKQYRTSTSASTPTTTPSRSQITASTTKTTTPTGQKQYSAQAGTADRQYQAQATTSNQGQFQAQAGTQSSAQATASGPRIGTKFEDLPQAVQDTVLEQHSSAEIADIDKQSRDGQTVYQISFKESGRNPSIYVSEDGSLVDQSELRERAGASRERLEAPKSGRGASEALLLKNTPVYSGNRNDLDADVDEPAGASAEISSSASTSTEAAGADRRSATASAATSDLPEAVQKAIEQRAGAAKVRSVEKKMVYEVTFEDPGSNPKLSITSDGRVLDSKSLK